MKLTVGELAVKKKLENMKQNKKHFAFWTSDVNPLTMRKEDVTPLEALSGFEKDRLRDLMSYNYKTN